MRLLNTYLVRALLLGIIQGLTEFLPISSSGHLVLFQYLFGMQEPDLLLDVMLHCGTTLAVLMVFGADILTLLRGTLKGLREGLNGAGWGRVVRHHTQLRLMLLIGAGSIPTALIGLLFQKPLEALFGAPRLVGLALVATGSLLWLTRRHKGTNRPNREMDLFLALWIGTVQGLAIMPGISRSGSTIAVGLLLGLERVQAVRYSFLLSIPAILGATALKIGQLGAVTPDIWLATWGGALVALLVGCGALRLLLGIVIRGSLAYFAYYCWLVGLALFLLVR